ncbi:hypothetical protein EDD11_000623 [Mortierella claussenii]|nr:hypothetical protein EDD11_000623 [Mortierella claussenii]
MAVIQGSNGQPTESPSAFDAERARLMTNISLEMGQMITNVTILQRNLDTIVTIGQEFEQLSQLWKHFHASVFQLAENDLLETHQAQEETRNLDELERVDEGSFSIQSQN